MKTSQAEPRSLNKQNKVGNFRWVIVALLFFATTISYLDRQVFALLKPTLEKEFTWSETDYSYLVMAFTAAYATGLLVFGRIIDKIGTKIGYAVSVIWWSLAGVLTATATSTFGFGVFRALLGLGEGGNFPAAIKTVAEWFPKKERAFATGLFNSGANIGAVITPIMVPWILGVYSWKAAFIITGGIGFVWFILWWFLYYQPSKHKLLTQEEYDYINSDVEERQTEHEQPVKWIQLFGIRQTWAFVFGKLLTDPIWWFYLYWLPAYFNASFNIDISKGGLPLATLYTFASIGSIGGGYLSGYLIKKGWLVFKARKTSMLFFALCVVPIMAIQFTTNIWQAVALLSLATAAHQAWSANIFTTASDMFPKKAVSSVVGIGGMAGSLGGFVFPYIIGQLLDHYKALGNITTGYNILFVICGLAYLIAWGFMHLFAPKMEKVNI
ncbi:MFS transporter [Cytophagaceae bacterium YF14B1]|uniref:MFS transporter n=1 Tax=Xanthocytophaga flava TaxID=3048013 RepID=A0AAE3QIZ0_9BACT|nr:MFS transporter [Xanthocytophaga flavus]MDJ1468712.1 MFS transporter [Xanthocytophaga flavus]MDJ1480192.1 MFS transporter [Xanthocytophaga flavus]